MVHLLQLRTISKQSSCCLILLNCSLIIHSVILYSLIV